MNATLPRSLAFELAEICATRVHSNLIALHLAALAGKKRIDMEEKHFAEVRATIASIPDKWDRTDFIGDVKYLFHKMRAASGAAPTSRAYVASVRAFREIERSAFEKAA